MDSEDELAADTGTIAVCTVCGGAGAVTGYINNGTPVAVRCTACRGTGIEHR